MNDDPQQAPSTPGTPTPVPASAKPGSRDGLAALAIVILAMALIALAINKII